MSSPENKENRKDSDYRFRMQSASMTMAEAQDGRHSDSKFI